MKKWFVVGGLLLTMAAVPLAVRAQAGEGVILSPANGATVPVDGHVTLRLMRMDAEGNLSDKTVPVDNSLVWTVNGKDLQQFNADGQEGRLSPSLSLLTATYTAPHTVPKINPVAVSMTYHPAPPSPQTVTLVCNIKVVERKNFFTLKDKELPAQYYSLDERYSTGATIGMLASAMMAGPITTVRVGAMEPNLTDGATLHANATMMVYLEGSQPGSYTWEVPPGKNSVMLTVAGANGAEMYSSIDCRPHGSNDCKATPMPGESWIKSYDAASGMLDGEFSGTLVKLENGKPSTYASTSGSFHVKAGGLPMPMAMPQ
ncbi:MAG TPA: hypothetical protein VLZ50_15670 [Terracidiphilus sp.]|nr:hypothetical protein [Terracidiphilus sp.]